MNTISYNTGNMFMPKIGDELSDVKILVGEESYEINAHSFVLVKMSKYFETQLNLKNLAKQQSNKLNLSQYSKKVMEAIINYGYGNDISLNDENIEKIVEAVDYLQFNRLFEVCFDFMRKVVNGSNSLYFRKLATKYNKTNFAAICEDVALMRMSEACLSEEFLSLKGEEIISMINSDKVIGKDIFKRTVEWFKLNKDADKFIEMLKTIDFREVKIEIISMELDVPFVQDDIELKQFTFELLLWKGKPKNVQDAADKFHGKNKLEKPIIVSMYERENSEDIQFLSVERDTGVKRSCIGIYKRKRDNGDM